MCFHYSHWKASNFYLHLHLQMLFYGFSIALFLGRGLLCPMADSQLVLELLFWQRRGGCSLSIRKKSNTVREQPPRLCKNNNSKINCESAIGQHLLTNPECAKIYTDDNFRIIGQARSSFHLSVLGGICLYQDSKPSLV